MIDVIKKHAEGEKHGRWFGGLNWEVWILPLFVMILYTAVCGGERRYAPSGISAIERCLKTLLTLDNA